MNAIQVELHRMRMATKAQVDSLAIEREVRGALALAHVKRSFTLCECPRMQTPHY